MMSISSFSQIRRTQIGDSVYYLISPARIKAANEQFIELNYLSVDNMLLEDITYSQEKTIYNLNQIIQYKDSVDQVRALEIEQCMGSFKQLQGTYYTEIDKKLNRRRWHIVTYSVLGTVIAGLILFGT